MTAINHERTEKVHLEIPIVDKNGTVLFTNNSSTIINHSSHDNNNNSNSIGNSNSNNSLTKMNANNTESSSRQPPRRYNSFRSTITTNSSTSQKKANNKIPLPPAINASTRARSESTSSRSLNISIRQSKLYNSTNNKQSNDSLLSKKSTSAKSISASSRRSSSSVNSKKSIGTSSQKLQLLSSSPKFLPWAFQNVSSRLVPSDLEIADYDHSVMLLNRQLSLSDSVSSLNNDSGVDDGDNDGFDVDNDDGNGLSSFDLPNSYLNQDQYNYNVNSKMNGYSYIPQQQPYAARKTHRRSLSGTSSGTNSSTNNNSGRTNTSTSPRNKIYSTSTTYKDQLITMDTIHSSQTAVFENSNTSTVLYSNNNSMDADLSFDGSMTSMDGVGADYDIDDDLYKKATPIAGSKRISKKKKPPLHSQQQQQQQMYHQQQPKMHNLQRHNRSHSADFIDMLPQDSLLTKEVISPERKRSTNNPDYGAITNGSTTTNLSKSPKHVDYQSSSSSPNRIQRNISSFENEDIHQDVTSSSNSREVVFDPLIAKKKGRNFRRRSETIPGTSAMTPIKTTYATTTVPYPIKQYDLGKYDLYESFQYPDYNFNNDPNLTNVNAFASSKMSLLGPHSVTSAKTPRRSLRRRIFLLLTEPQTSILSATFFAIYFIMLLISLVVMMMQTMRMFQEIPEGCEFCNNLQDLGNSSSSYFETYDNMFDTDNNGDSGSGYQQLNHVACVCPPVPRQSIIKLEDWIIYFFSVEWIVRVASYEPLNTGEDSPHLSFWQYLIEPYTVLDFLATFPYYLIRFHKLESLSPIRLLRVFRVFQLLRLERYDIYLTTMIRVFIGSVQAMHIYLLTLLFLAAVFGSIIYWFEKGEWKYTTELLEEPGYAYIRVGADGITEELTPFHSIPGSFWWFFVTATTAGYGDAYPTSTCGKIVAVFALLCGVLVIAFPVSIFSELWSKELQAIGELRNLYETDDDDDDDLSYQLSEERQAPVKFVSTTSDHNVLGSDSVLALGNSNSFDSTIHESNEKNTLSNEDSLTKIENESRKSQKNNGTNKNETSRPVSEFTAQDVADLRRYVESIEDAQQKIRNILAKMESPS